MKIAFLIFPLFLVACAEQSFIQKISAPSETIHNEKCAEIQKYRIFQVIDNGSLAMACENTYGIESCLGLTVFIPKEKGKIYYDDMIVEPSTDKCIIYADVYRYTTNRGDTRTVPKIKFENKDIPNPDFVEWQKTQSNQ